MSAFFGRTVLFASVVFLTVATASAASADTWTCDGTTLVFKSVQERDQWINYQTNEPAGLLYRKTPVCHFHKSAAPTTKASPSAGYRHRPDFMANQCVRESFGTAERLTLTNICNKDVVVSQCPVGAGPSHCNPSRQDMGVYSATLKPGGRHDFPVDRGSTAKWAACYGPSSSVRVLLMGNNKYRCMSALP